MVLTPFSVLTARSLWLKYAPPDNVGTQKDFWADIVLYIKAHQGKSIFFDELIKQVCLQTEADEYIKLPLSLLVDNLVQAETIFDDELWESIIKEWAKIKIDLKIKIQTLVLKKENLLKRFLRAIFGESKNRRQNIRQIAKDSGLLKDYTPNDVIMMLCNVVAESLEMQRQAKEMEAMEGIFQMDEDTAIGTNDKSAQCSPMLRSGKQDLQALWDFFLAEFEQIDSLDECWPDTDIYVNEIQEIAERKIKERNAIIKRRNLVTEFTNKADYIEDAFRSQLDDLDILIPTANMETSFDNVALEGIIEIFNSLQQVMQKYKELAVAKKTTLLEEKKRIGQIFTVMTDIENLVASLSEITTNVLPLQEQENVKEEQQDLPAEIQQQAVQTQTIVEEETSMTAEETEENESSSVSSEEMKTEDEQEEQIELFMGK